MLSMHVHILSILWALALASAKGYVPRATKSLIEGPGNSPHNLAHFDDSDTLMLVFGDRLHISPDNGEHWKPINEIEDPEFVFVDLFHQERGFVRTQSEKINEIHVTEDQGKSWRKLAIPVEVEGDHSCSITTHPFDSNLLLLPCSISNEKYFGNIIYASNDSGKSFRNIVGAPDLPDMHARCRFAASSKDSTLEKDGIYCIHTVDNTTGTQVQYPNPHSKGLAEVSFQQEHQSVDTLFYTTDLGKTRKTFEELNGYSVEQMFVLPHGIAVTTSEGNYFEAKKLWISNGVSFNLAYLPENMGRIWWINYDVSSLPGDVQGRLLVKATVSSEDNGKRRRAKCLLVSDSSGLNFSWDCTELQGSDSIHGLRLIRSNSPLKPHIPLWGTFDFCKDTLLRNVLMFLKNLFSKWSYIRMLLDASVTKGSFDNGETWTNLKVVDPSGKHRHLFKCDINDVENCSFQERLSHSMETLSGIIMKVGTVGKYYEVSPDTNDMTFISRDGGVSWELAFEFPVKATFLDFGNIIVAISEENSEIYTKFLFSLDQGRTWDEYYFDEPISNVHRINFYGRGLKTIIGFIRELEDSEEYVSYLVDFSNAFNGTACTENDWERWYLSNGNCIDGMRYSYDRRKPDAKCLMRKAFDKLELHEEKCEY